MKEKAVVRLCVVRRSAGRANGWLEIGWCIGQDRLIGYSLSRPCGRGSRIGAPIDQRAGRSDVLFGRRAVFRPRPSSVAEYRRSALSVA